MPTDAVSSSDEVVRPAEPLALRVVGLAKSFGPTRAVASFDFELRPGEVHAIMGENGSGKSTVVKILTGVHAPDAGVVEVGGAAHSSFASPRKALAAGIVAVFQEVLVVPPRSVLENIWLGSDDLFASTLSQAEKQRRAQATLERLLATPPPLATAAEELSLSDRQACCLARALVREPKILILDEATSALDVETRDRLFAIVKQLAEAGNSVVFISHRMDEIRQIADRVTVMRSGVSVATLDGDTAAPEQLVQLMTGSEHATGEAAEAVHRPTGDVVLRAEGLVLAPGARPIDFEIRKGEIVGVAGLEGHGQDRFLQALVGAKVPAGKVFRVTPKGEHQLTSSRRAAGHGVSLVPRERRNDALFPSLSVLENFGVMTLGSDARFGLINTRRTAARFKEYIAQIGIKYGRLRDPITTLSGGNQQKVVIARALATQPAVLLLNDPTRGVDIGSKMDIYRLLTDLSVGGVAIVMLSTEVDEHVELMDRVVVFREAEIAAEHTGRTLTRDELVSSFFGGREHAA